MTIILTGGLLPIALASQSSQPLLSEEFSMFPSTLAARKYIIIVHLFVLLYAFTCLRF